MKLMDVLPADANALHAAMHGKMPTQEERALRIASLKPLADAVRKCMEQCGPATRDAECEYAVFMSAVCVIDSLLDKFTRVNA